MKRLGRIAAFSLATAGCVALAGHVLMAGNANRHGADRAGRLEKAAAQRFEDGRGLSPCDLRARLLVDSARVRMIALGEAQADPIVIVAPTFSEIEVVAFEPDFIRTYRFTGRPTLGAPPGEEFLGPVQQVGELPVLPLVLGEIIAPVNRNIRYAMTAREFGPDGITFYFGRGEDGCAFAWTPRGKGPASLIADLVNEASTPAPSVEKLRSLAAAIDDADESL